MDPFSITVGALGITDAAISSIVALRNTVDSIAAADKTVQEISADLEAVQRPLDVLGTLSIPDKETYGFAKASLEQTGVAETVNNCGQACADFSKRLDQWTRHSTDTRLSLRDHLSDGLWNKEKLSRFRTQVKSCRANVQFATQTTQLYAVSLACSLPQTCANGRRIVQLRSERTSIAERAVVKQQLQTLELAVREHIEMTRSAQVEAQRRRAEIERGGEDDGDDAQQVLAVQEVDQRSRLLEADQVSSGVALVQVRQGLSEQDISKVFTDEDSRAVVGMPASVVGKVNQRIRDVQTKGNSAAVVGVYADDVRMGDIFKR